MDVTCTQSYPFVFSLMDGMDIAWTLQRPVNFVRNDQKRFETWAAVDASLKKNSVWFT